MRMKIVVSGLVAGCLLATSSQLWAQDTNTTSTNMPPRLRAPGGPGGAGARPGGLMGILSEEQMASLQKARAAQTEKLRELQPKMQAAQKEVFEASLSPKFDEVLVHQKAEAAAQIYADILVAQAKAFSEIQPPLSPEQIEQLKNMQSPAANPRVLRPQPRPGGATNSDQNGLPPKQ